jgi:hypothetical protein
VGTLGPARMKNFLAHLFITKSEKLIVRYPPQIMSWFMRIFLPWGDKIMMSKRLLNFKKLSEKEKFLRLLALQTPCCSDS